MNDDLMNGVIQKCSKRVLRHDLNVVIEKKNKAYFYCGEYSLNLQVIQEVKLLSMLMHPPEPLLFYSESEAIEQPNRIALY